MKTRPHSLPCSRSSGEYKTLHLYFYGSLVAMLVSTTVYHYVLFEGHPRLPIPSSALAHGPSTPRSSTC